MGAELLVNSRERPRVVFRRDKAPLEEGGARRPDASVKFGLAPTDGRCANRDLPRIPGSRCDGERGRSVVETSGRPVDPVVPPRRGRVGAAGPARDADRRLLGLVDRKDNLTDGGLRIAVPVPKTVRLELRNDRLEAPV